MSFHDTSFPRGDDAVGRLAERSATEQLLVRGIRLWLEGPDAQARVWNEFATTFGPAHGRLALRAFEAYLEAVACSIERRLWRHAPGCPCIGRDEEALASLVTLAARGQSGAAVAVAARLVRVDAIQSTIETATELGRLLFGLQSSSPDLEGSMLPGRSVRTLH